MSRNFSTFERGGVRLKKGLGQNLLSDKNYIKKIIDVINIDKKDTIVEIGSGLGAITLEMAKIAKKIICIEKDREMVEALNKKIKENKIKNIEVINEDILNLFSDGYFKIGKTKKYKVVANIPYYLTSILIRNLLESTNTPEDIFLMIQKEVGKRICSKPGEMSILSVSVQYYAEPKILFEVSKNCFYPKPKIDSVFIQIRPKRIDRNDNFFELVKLGFSHPRKQLIHNLSSLDREFIRNWLLENKLRPGERAECLSIPQWEDLFIKIKNHK